MAKAPEHDEVGAIELALEIGPIAVVAERRRGLAAGIGDAIVVGDDGVAVDFGSRLRQRCLAMRDCAMEMLYWGPASAKLTAMPHPQPLPAKRGGVRAEAAA